MIESPNAPDKKKFWCVISLISADSLKTYNNWMLYKDI